MKHSKLFVITVCSILLLLGSANMAAHKERHRHEL